MTTIPIVETYRGVPVHDYQTRDRIEDAVMPAIDEVFDLVEPDALFGYAADPGNPPEARLFAGAKYRAAAELRADLHEHRLRRLALLAAHLAGLDSMEWIDPWQYGTLLDPSRVSRPERPAEHRGRIIAAKHRPQHAAAL